MNDVTQMFTGKSEKIIFVWDRVNMIIRQVALKALKERKSLD